MTNTNSLYIPVHSVSDLITNSSSTTYTMATDGTIKCVKEIVNSFLAVAGSTKTADDMFEFSLKEELDEFDDPVDGDDYHNIILCVTPKNKTDPVTTKVAGLIEALIGTYNFDSSRDG